MSINFKDLAERVGVTFLLTFSGLIMVAGPTLNANVAQVAAVGGLAAVLSLVKNIITTISGASNGATWWQDMLLRVMGTYVQSWIAIVVVASPGGGSTIDFEQIKPAALAAIPAALGILKGYVASKFGDPSTAGFFTSMLNAPAMGQHEAPAPVALPVDATTPVLAPDPAPVAVPDPTPAPDLAASAVLPDPHDPAQATLPSGA